MILKPTKPVLKWAGGKRQLLNELITSLPKCEYNNYIEPFIGGGALLFNLQPQNARINDYNDELINMYLVIKESADELIANLEKYQKMHSPEFFYYIRSMDRNGALSGASNVEKAARTIYLNRTCYNGLFRVNRNGYFNTPIGKYKNPKILDKENIIAISEYLNSGDILITTGDFENIALSAERNDFIYLDPPYYPLSSTSSFTDYTKMGFGEEDQIRLKEVCDKLNDRGVLFLQSNSNCEYIKKLYKDYNIKEVSVRRAINSNKDNRNNITEVLISNYAF